MACTINHNKSYTDCPYCGRLQWHCWTCGDNHSCDCQDARTLTIQRPDGTETTVTPLPMWQP